jgi:hypothetical protein
LEKESPEFGGKADTVNLLSSKIWFFDDSCGADFPVWM